MSWFLVYTLYTYIRRPPAARAVRARRGGGALLRLDHRIPGRQKCAVTYQSLIGHRYAPVSAVWGSPPSPHARSGPNANRKRISRDSGAVQKTEVRSARSHSRHWKPGATPAGPHRLAQPAPLTSGADASGYNCCRAPQRRRGDVDIAVIAVRPVVRLAFAFGRREG